MILQLRHTTFIAQRLKEIHKGRETGLMDNGPLLFCLFLLLYVPGQQLWSWQDGQNT